MKRCEEFGIQNMWGKVKSYIDLTWESTVGRSSVQLLSRVQLFVTPWIAAHQASLSITNSRSLLKLMSIESVMPSNHLILCHPLLLLPSIFPSIRVFSSELALRIRWPKYWSFSFSIIPSKEIPGLISFRIGIASSCLPVLTVCMVYLLTYLFGFLFKVDFLYKVHVVGLAFTILW